jgi:hypothetical protein
VVFAKHWTAGRAKTRLAAGIGDQAAALVARWLFDATLGRLAAIDARRVVAFDPSERESEFRDALPQGWRLEPQGDGDLGMRMARVLQSGAPTVLLGSDSPHLPLEEVQRAVDWVADAEGPRLALGPTDDGGYWLLASRGEVPPIFDGIAWGTPSVWPTTLARLDDAGWRPGIDYRLVEEWYDIDEVPDLLRLKEGLQQRPRGDAALDELAQRLATLDFAG